MIKRRFVRLSSITETVRASKAFAAALQNSEVRQRLRRAVVKADPHRTARYMFDLAKGKAGEHGAQ